MKILNKYEIFHIYFFLFLKMATAVWQNARIRDQHSIFLGNSGNLYLTNDGGDYGIIKGHSSTAGFKIQTGAGGIILDSTTGSGNTSNNVSGVTSLISASSSSWSNTQGNLSLLTSGSGNLILSAADNFSLSGNKTSSITMSGSGQSINITNNSTGSGNINCTANNGAVNLSASNTSTYSVSADSQSLILQTTGVGSNLKFSTNSGDVLINASGGATNITSASSSTFKVVNDGSTFNIANTGSGGILSLTTASGSINSTSLLNSTYSVTGVGQNINLSSTGASGNVNIESTQGSVNITSLLDSIYEVTNNNSNLYLKSTGTGTSNVEISSTNSAVNISAAAASTIALSGSGASLNLTANGTSSNLVLSSGSGNFSLAAPASSTIAVNGGGNLGLSTVSGSLNLSSSSSSVNVTSTTSSLYKTTGNSASTAISSTGSNSSILISASGASNYLSLYATGSGNLTFNNSSILQTASGNLSILNTGSNDILIGSNTAGSGKIVLDSNTNTINIGGSGATAVFLGRAGVTTTINGNLNVLGTTNTVSSTQSSFSDNIVLYNTGSGGTVTTVAGNDSGYLGTRAESDVVSTHISAVNYTSGSGQVSSAPTTWSQNTLELSASDFAAFSTANSLQNYYLSFATGSSFSVSGIWHGQYGQISSNSASGLCTVTNNWNPINITTDGSVINPLTASGTLLTGSGGFNSQLSPGCSITVNGNQYIVSSVTDDNTAILASGNANISGGSGQITSPGSGVNYFLNGSIYVGMVFQESTGQFLLTGSVTNPVNNVSSTQLLDLKLNNLTGNSARLTASDPITYNGSSFSGGSLISGAAGFSSNVMIESNQDTSAPLVVAQNSSTYQHPAIDVRQNYASGPVISITAYSSGSGMSSSYMSSSLVPINSSGSGFLNQEITGFMMINVSDSNGLLSNGNYYLPLYSLSV
jgi:hypothetical protein